MRKVIEIDKAPQPGGPYSQAVEVENLIFLTGQGSIDPKTGKVVGEDITAQTEQTLTNAKNVLEAAGSSLGKVVKVNIYLSNLNDWQKLNDAYKKFFKPPYPARTTVGCSLLPGLKVEIDIIAEK